MYFFFDWDIRRKLFTFLVYGYDRFFFSCIFPPPRFFHYSPCKRTKSRAFFPLKIENQQSSSNWLFVWFSAFHGSFIWAVLTNVGQKPHPLHTITIWRCFSWSRETGKSPYKYQHENNKTIPQASAVYQKNVSIIVSKNSKKLSLPAPSAPHIIWI